MQQTIEDRESSTLKKVAATLVISFTLAGVAQAVRAADAPAPANANKKEEIEEVVVTGSLIPQAKIETATPVVTVTIDDIQTKGFATIADALQHSSFATGGVQGGNTSNSFTQGANTVSLFGLNPGYTKFLIDGKPIADYPALYNGSDNFVNISGIPTLLIEGVDELPGAQSSIYGSDAIAGVINIRLRKHMDGPEVDARYGWSTDGGGVNKRLAIADGFSFGGVNIIVGGQYEKTDPIWSYKRSLTSQYFAGNPRSHQTAERDWLVLGTFGDANGNLYYFNNVDPTIFPNGLDPSQCGNVSNQVNGTVGLRSRANRGNYCGTYQAQAFTLSNGTESTQGYLHASDDLNEHIQLYADVLVDHDVARFSLGGGFFGTSGDTTGPYYYFLDPRLGDLINLQQLYTPEEVGGLNNTMNKDTTNSLRMTVGAKGDFASTDWNYDASFTFTENKLTEATHLQFQKEINDFYASIMGPSLGVDPNYGVNIYEPDYAAFFKPITPAQYASFSGYAISRSRTEDSMLRVQLTDAKLFPLPGGNAGFAVVGEAGAQGWEYDPDPRYQTGETYLYTATAGSGHRARYAMTAELKLPIVPMLTADLSGRYDDYRAAGETVSAGTYDLGLEFRPLNNVLFRGRYGTAFKAPTLADQFQGPSGFFQSVNDYYACAQKGYPGDASCPYFGNSVQGQTSGNTKLKPITAKVWDLGVAYSPISHSNLTFDFIRWRINDEVQQQDAQRLVDTDGECLSGVQDINSPTCQNAISQVQRDSNGLITLISTPKVNISSEALSVAVLGLNFEFPTTRAGTFIVDGHYTNVLRHRFTQFPGDAEINYLEDPFYSTEFKTRENLSLTWNYKNFGTTFYVERYGRTPNYISTTASDGYAEKGGGRIGTWTLANLEVQYEVLSGLVVSGHVNNIANKMPPEDNSYLGTIVGPYNALDYNPYGRSFYVEATYKYGKSK